MTQLNLNERKRPALAAAPQRLVLIDTDTRWRLSVVPLEWVDRQDPERLDRGMALYLVDHGNGLYELWPRPEALTINEIEVDTRHVPLG